MEDKFRPSPATFTEVIRASFDVLRLVARYNPGLIAMTLVNAVILGALPVIENAIRGSMINHLVVSAGAGQWSWIIVLLLSGVIGISYITNAIARYDNYLSGRVWQRTRQVIEFEVIRAKTTLSLEQHEDPKMSNLVQRVTERGGDASQFAVSAIDIVAVLVTCISAAIALATSYWWLCALILIGLIPQLWHQTKASRESWEHNRAHTEEWRLFWRIRTYFWTAREIMETKLFGLVEYFTERAQRMYSKLIDGELQLDKKQLTRGLGLGMITQTVLAFSLAYFVWQVIHGQMQVGTLTFLFGIVVTLSSSVVRLFGDVGKQYQRALFITDLMRLLRTPSTMKNAEGAYVAPADTTPEIRFEHVSFTYPGSEKPTLRNISFVLKPGDKFALIGINGAGKTTLVKLLCRLYDPTEGSITVNGVDLRDVDLASYYAAFGILFQEFNRYVMPIKEAISLGDVSHRIDEQRVKEAAQASEADTFITAFSKGYDQLLGKDFTGGEELSGGQWQKLAIARVFYRNPQVWVLDEPTAAIDAEAEARIFDRIEQLPDDRSAIVISHRFSTVRNADQILVLKDGTISEQGTHEELIKANKDYARLFNLQAKRYQDKENID